MFLTRPSVSQSVSPVFLVSATPLKPLNWIMSAQLLWNCSKEFLKLCSYKGHNIHRKFDSLFFLRFTSFLNFESRPKWKIQLKQFVSATPLKPLNTISRNFVVMKDIMCRCAYPQKILIQFIKHLMEERYNSCFCIINKKNILLYFS